MRGGLGLVWSLWERLTAAAGSAVHFNSFWPLERRQIALKPLS